MQAELDRERYRAQVTGCWMGKNIGGTLGAPFEWRRQVNEVAFYTQELQGDPLPNDDLDLQLLWLVALEEQGLDLQIEHLAEYWCTYVTPHWSEYGTAKINMRAGLMPPLAGSYGNAFKHSCGAFIRSEIWACIAPGLPAIAAEYARRDAMLDHGDGEGTYAEIFCAALESAAFVGSDLRELIDLALGYIPADCAVAAAVATAVGCVDEGLDWRDARDRILDRHRGAPIFGDPRACSAADRAKGYDQGELGFDVPSNIAILVLAVLQAGEDFDLLLTIAVGCGEDTDCTCATAGSLFGIMHGIDAIPHRWIEPIGRKIKTACLNLGELGFFGDQLPADIDVLTERVTRIAEQLLLRHHARGLRFVDGPGVLPSGLDDLRGGCIPVSKLMWHTGTMARVSVDYGSDGPVMRRDQPKRLRIGISVADKIQLNCNLRWYLPAGWRCEQGLSAYALVLPTHFNQPCSFEVELVAERLDPGINRAVLELTIPGRPTVQLVPISLLNGAVLGSGA